MIINKRTKDAITEVLIEQIITGKLPENYSLKQTELAEVLNVSRIPIRESLMTLESTGLLVRRNTHFYTMELTERDIYQMFKLQNDFDVMVLENLPKESIDKIKAESESYKADTYNFHKMVYSLMRNPFLVVKYTTNLDTFLKFVTLNYQENPKEVDILIDYINGKEVDFAQYYKTMASKLIDMRKENAK